MQGAFRDIEHLFRMAGLFAVGTATFLVVRAVLVPVGFGDLGHFRAGAIDDNAAQAPVYAGRQVCETCHDDVAEARAGGAHEGIGCEACHGPLAAHADDPGPVVAATPPVGLTCSSCHAFNGARPSWFPQVDEEEHSGGADCTECHDQHSPGFD